ncbi:MAG: protocatechuate 3,4-dioxygenase subunit beta [Pseudorhodoplanes sp.]|uniref:protocatechuate 3,4-dioxygenase subunit beta n=1 Tax=Pseudorhodoplanes sp. TaxID=1934341 RepID=UPI003D13BD4A
MSLIYPLDGLSAYPKHLSPDYKSTVKRSPTRPLILAPHTLSELTGPIYGHDAIQEFDNDLTKQGKGGEPLGERIIVHGHILDEDKRPVPDALVEIWQANACGRYVHIVDQHPAPLDPNFTGAGRTVTDKNGYYKFITVKPGAYPWGNHYNAWRPNHIHFSVFGHSFLSRLVTQMYFPGDYLFPFDPIFNSVPDAKDRDRMVSTFDLDNTVPDWALAFRFDIVLRGREQTPPDLD